MLAARLAQTPARLACLSRNTRVPALRALQQQQQHWRVRHATTSAKPASDPARRPSGPAATAGSDVAPAQHQQQQRPAKPVYPERLCVYHAGTPKIVFLAFLKLTTIFNLGLFDLVVAPSYLDLEGVSLNFGLAFCSGLVPFMAVHYFTAPFVSFIHMRLPPWARQSEDALRRYMAGILPPSSDAAAAAAASTSSAPVPSPATSSTPTSTSTSTSTTSGGGAAPPPPPAGGGPKLEITTMSAIAKPRGTVAALADLRPAPPSGSRRRLGLVDVVVARGSPSDRSREADARPWYRQIAAPPAEDFCAQFNSLRRTGWVWEGLMRAVRQRGREEEEQGQR